MNSSGRYSESNERRIVIPTTEQKERADKLNQIESEKATLFQALSSRLLNPDELLKAASHGSDLNLRTHWNGISGYTDPYNKMEQLAELQLAWQIQHTLQMGAK